MWEVMGQDRAVSFLRSSLNKGNTAHAYLLVGSPNVGKMTLALNLAQALNCEEAEPPCGQCNSCQKIASTKHADIQIIGLISSGNSSESKAKAEIGIDQIREVQHSANLPPFEGKYKVFIIDEAELLSTEAANCLLKTLEEPISKVVFILLVRNDRLLPATVVSRCQIIELLPMAIDKVESFLINHRRIEPQKAQLLARLSHGYLGWAISASRDARLMEERINKIDKLLELVKSDYEERFTYSAQLASQFSQNRQMVLGVLDLWVDLWRDLLLIKSDQNNFVINIDKLDALVILAKNIGLIDMKKIIHGIRSAMEQLSQNANPRLVLEVLMLDMPIVRKTEIAGLIKK